jgi:hypothetical protein
VRVRNYLLPLLFGAPVDEVAGVEGDAEKIGGHETELGSADADDADDGAVDGGNDPALPEFPANENGGEHSKNTGKIIESNDVENI